MISHRVLWILPPGLSDVSSAGTLHSVWAATASGLLAAAITSGHKSSCATLLQWLPGPHDGAPASLCDLQAAVQCNLSAAHRFLPLVPLQSSAPPHPIFSGLCPFSGPSALNALSSPPSTHAPTPPCPCHYHGWPTVSLLACPFLRQPSCLPGLAGTSHDFLLEPTHHLLSVCTLCFLRARVLGRFCDPQPSTGLARGWKTEQSRIHAPGKSSSLQVTAPHTSSHPARPENRVMEAAG